MSLNNICQEYKPAFGFLLPLKCLLNTFTASGLLWHIAVWAFIMQTFHPLETTKPTASQQIADCLFLQDRELHPK